MFQKKKDELFTGMPNIFTIFDGILIAGFDEQGKTMMKYYNRYSRYAD